MRWPIYFLFAVRWRVRGRDLARPMVRAGFPDWRNPAPYLALAGHDASSHAWEWLRRDRGYQDAVANGSSDPAVFGLIQFENSDLDASVARPFWMPGVDPFALTAFAEPVCGDGEFDLDRVPGPVTSFVDRRGQEHFLIGESGGTIRLHVASGSLRTGAVRLTWGLPAIGQALPAITTLRRLAMLCRKGRMPPLDLPSRACTSRWLQLLRVHDAVAEGASQHEIASVLFGRRIPSSRWRIEAGCYRLRVQRLVRASREIAAQSPMNLLRAGSPGAPG